MARVKFRKVAGLVLSLALTVALLAWFLRGADLAKVAHDAAGASLPFLALAVACEVLSILLKAFRWGIMLRTIRQNIPLGPLLKATVVSFAMTGVLPGRVGEIAKPFLLARWVGLPFPPLLASVLLERLMDLLAMVLLWVLFIFVGRSAVAGSGTAYLPYLDLATAVILAASILGGALLWWVTRRQASFEARLRNGEASGWGPWRIRVLRLLLQFAEGLGMFRRKRDILAVVGCSLGVWGILVITSWAVVRALGIQIPLSGGIVILIFVNAGAGLPTPGGMGGVHKLIQVALMSFYAVGENQAVAVGIVGHAAMFFPGILWGLLYLATGRVSLAELRRSGGAHAAELEENGSPKVN